MVLYIASVRGHRRYALTSMTHGIGIAAFVANPSERSPDNEGGDVYPAGCEIVEVTAA